jgi:1-acyl-sn-glycerol-3-phosphate acyltransferase
MAGKTGVARLALASDVPVIPVAHWGAHRILAYKSKRPSLFPRKPVLAIAGRPFDMSPYRGKDPTNETLREITDRLMTEVKTLLGELRQQTPPADLFVPSAAATAASTVDEAPTGAA